MSSFHQNDKCPSQSMSINTDHSGFISLALIMMLLVVLALVGSSVAFRLPEQKIVNGEDTSTRDFPHQGSLRTSSGSHTCGCVLISATRALTAAHCVGGFR